MNLEAKFIVCRNRLSAVQVGADHQHGTSGSQSSLRLQGLLECFICFG
jgi:hypothetical protein